MMPGEKHTMVDEIAPWILLVFILVFDLVLLAMGYTEMASYIIGAITLPVVRKLYGINGDKGDPPMPPD